MRHRLLAVLAAAALLAAACGDDEETDEAVPAQGTTTTEAASTEDPASEAGSSTSAELALATTDLGDILVDGDGMTVYLFLPDAQGESTCYDQCADTWPPLDEVTSVGAGLDDALLGTTTRTDGTVQATYNGWPLYHFAPDAAPGDTNGQGLNDVWYVVDATGNAVGAATTSTESTTAAGPSY